MTPETIIKQVAADDIRLALSRDGKIKATGEQAAVNRWLQTIKANKPGIVAALQERGDATISDNVYLTTAMAIPTPVPGSWIEWNSPMFGLLVGEVIEATASTITVWHPLAEKLITIPSAWVTRILPESKGNVRHDDVSTRNPT